MIRGKEELTPFTEDEVLPFKGDPALVERAKVVQEKVRHSQVAGQIRWLTFLNGKRPTIENLSSSLQVSQRKLETIIRNQNLQAFQLPQVIKDPVPANEAAFFTGLSLGRLEMGRVNWSGHTYIAVATESSDQRKHALISTTFGRWGEVRKSDTAEGKGRKRTKVYVDNSSFGFLLSEGGVGSSILLSHTKYPAFLLGFMAIKLLDSRDRLSLSNPDQLESIYRNCERHLGISLGRFHIEKRPEGRLGVIEVKNPGEIFAALAQAETVSRLPYFRQLAEIAA